MRNRLGLNNLFSRDRRVLYIILSIVMISVLTLTVVYAALSTTLNINGNADVTSASWDIYLDNIQLNSNSATTNIPTITDKTTASFSTTLSKPGDYYMFTVDVVNNGTIDAMINSVTKTPELTDSQKKYLNYIVEYENGELISTKQLVSMKSFVRLKVKVEFRKDISSSDLPTKTEILNLSFKVNYVQSDDSDENVTVDNNGKWPKVISGDLQTVGSEVAIGDEHFYIISSDESSVTMLAKYNLEVGNICISSTSCSPIENPSGIQNSMMIGYPSDGSYPRYGTKQFSSTKYWGNVSSGTYVYDSNSKLYDYMENYKQYLESQKVTIEEVRLIKMEELEFLGCSKATRRCTEAPDWVYSSSYWTGTVDVENSILAITSNGVFGVDSYGELIYLGVRPVITLTL